MTLPVPAQIPEEPAVSAVLILECRFGHVQAYQDPRSGVDLDHAGRTARRMMVGRLKSERHVASRFL